MKTACAAAALVLALIAAPAARAEVNFRNTDANLLIVGLLSFALSAGPSSSAPKNYVGAQIGAGRMNFASAGNGVVTNPNQFVYGLLYGYKYYEHLAMEFELTEVGLFYTRAGAAQYATLVDAFPIYAVARIPLGDSFELLGRAGVAVTYAYNIEGGTGDTSTRIAPAYGVAAQYNFSGHTSVRLRWDHYAVNAPIPQGPAISAVGQNTHAAVVGAGVVYRF